MKPTKEDLDAYRQRIEAMDEAALLHEAELQIWLSAFADNNPRAPAHWKVDDVIYPECKRRPGDLYQRAYDAAVKSAGHPQLASDYAA